MEEKKDIRGLTDMKYYDEMSYSEPNKKTAEAISDAVNNKNLNSYNSTDEMIDAAKAKKVDESMNVFERARVLEQQTQACKEKTEDDRLYDSIQNMTDEELKQAIDKEATDLKVGSGTTPEAYDPAEDAKDAAKIMNASSVNSLMVNDLDETELMQLYNVAMKAKQDPNLNILAELPKKVYDALEMNCKALGVTSRKAINSFARMLVGELVAEMSLDKECKAFQNELEKAMAFPEIVDMYAEHTRELMEKVLIQKAEAELDDTKKETLLATSKAYTDSYTFARQLELLKDDAFIRRLPKKIKRYERSCDDFNFTMSKSILKTAPLESLVKDLPYILQVSEEQAKAFVVMLAEVSKDIKYYDNPGIWFMYSSLRNIVTLARTGNTKTGFSLECIDYLKVLFNELEKREAELYSV